MKPGTFDLHLKIVRDANGMNRVVLFRITKEGSTPVRGDKLEQDITTAFNNACKEVKVREISIPLPPEVIDLIKFKRKAKRKYQLNRDVPEYKTALNQVTKAVTKAVKKAKAQ